MMIIYIFSSMLFLIASNVVGQEAISYWPKQIDLNEYVLTIYGPEPEKFENNILNARAAFSLFDKEHLPIFGAMWFRCRVHTDVKNNVVSFEDIHLVNANFPDASAEHIEQLQKLISAASQNWHFNSNLKLFYKALEAIDINNEYSEDLKSNPPKIYYSKVPAVLVFIDGEPIMANINGSELYQYIVNTPHFIIKSSSDQQYYLKGGSNWYTASDPTGIWKSIDTPPGYILQLANNANKLSPDAQKKAQLKSGKAPKLIVTKEPAELIQTNGEPEIKSVYENIFSISNSDDEILFDSYSNYYYILISGRWYKTKNLERGSWAFVAPEELPEIFKAIPPTSPVAHIRLSIPGTPESVSAALDNAIPQTAVVDRQKATMEIEFDGTPQFVAIEGTSLKYGVNTSGSIIQDENSTYYAVDQAIWFTSESTGGPWKAADNFPDEVRNIPPSCPVFNLKFVYIYDFSSNIIYTGYTVGYMGSFLYHGVVYYGTGYRYKPWYGNKYIPRPSTYGHGAKKKSKKGPNISFYASTGYGGFGGYPGMGFGHPYGGWGGYGYGGYGMTNTMAYNQYYYQGQQVEVDHGVVEEKPIDPINIYNNRTVGIIKTETTRRNDPSHPVILNVGNPETSDNIFADKDGNLFRQDDDGIWYERNNSAWVETDKSMLR